jgi:hypothetical protein
LRSRQLVPLTHKLDNDWSLKIIPGAFFNPTLSKGYNEHENVFINRQKALKSISNEYSIYQFSSNISKKIKYVAACHFDGCLEVYVSIHKYFDHLRKHTKERPF